MGRCTEEACDCKIYIYVASCPGLVDFYDVLDVVYTQCRMARIRMNHFIIV